MIGVRYALEFYLTSDYLEADCRIIARSPRPLRMLEESSTLPKVRDVLAACGHELPPGTDDWRFMNDDEISSYLDRDDQ